MSKTPYDSLIAQFNDQVRDPERLRAYIVELLEANGRLQEELVVAQFELRDRERANQSSGSVRDREHFDRVLDRTAFQRELDKRLEETRQGGHPSSVLMLEINPPVIQGDHCELVDFRPAIDTLGESLRTSLRGSDLLARYDDNHFAAVFPSMGPSDSERPAFRVLQTIHDRSIPHKGYELKFTASAGLTVTHADDSSAALLLRTMEAINVARDSGPSVIGVHDGSSCRTVVRQQESAANHVNQRRAERRPFLLRQLVAPYDGISLPPRALFEEVLCRDISTSGFSFVMGARPDWTRLVVVLGTPPEVTYMSADVMNIVPVEIDGRRMYRIGCRFANRLHVGPHIEAPSAPARIRK